MSEILQFTDSTNRNIINMHASPRPKVGDFSNLPYSPVDIETGVPLLIHPNAVERDRHIFPEDAHHPYHPKNELLSSQTLGSLALRHSRIQTISYDAHHNYYHHGTKGFYGPKLPVDDREIFNLVVLTVAKFIPEQAIAFTNNYKPYLKPLSSEIRHKLWKGNQIKVGTSKVVREFIKDYSFRQQLDVKESSIDEFLNTKDLSRKMQLGNTLLGVAVLHATEPIKDSYMNAYRAELIPNELSRIVSRFVMTTMGMKRNRPLIINEFSKRLLQQVA